jgi:hypothetical protein
LNGNHVIQNVLIVLVRNIIKWFIFFKPSIIVCIMQSVKCIDFLPIAMDCCVLQDVSTTLPKLKRSNSLSEVPIFLHTCSFPFGPCFISNGQDRTFGNCNGCQYVHLDLGDERFLVIIRKFFGNMYSIHSEFSSMLLKRFVFALMGPHFVRVFNVADLEQDLNWFQLLNREKNWKDSEDTLC